MKDSFILRVEAWELMLTLLVLMIVSVFIGLVAGRKFRKESTNESTILGSLFALLGLLLAFTFSMSVSRYDMRREIIIEEANDIGTAILRADLYRNADRKLLRADFEKYVNARIDFFTAGADAEKTIAAQNLSSNLQQQLWNRVSKLSKDSAYTIASMQMIPALNNMIDITTTRWYGNLAHLPDTIIYLLFLLSCACAFYIGYVFAGKEKIDWLHVGGFCLLTSLVVYVIFDMDRPRQGFIRLDQMNQSIVDLRQMFSVKEN